MARLTSELLRPVDAAQVLDEAALLRYAAAHVPGFPSPSPVLVLTQFGHGQSNPTYCLEASAPGGEETRRYVLRKKPPGAILQSAHAVEREFQVLKALAAFTDVPVPKVFCLCTDASVIGTPFYIMEYLEGILYLDNKLPTIVKLIGAASDITALGITDVLLVHLITELYKEANILIFRPQ